MRRMASTLLAVSVLLLAGCFLFNPGPVILYEETFSGATVDQWSVVDVEQAKYGPEDGQFHIRFKVSDNLSASILNDDQGPFDNFQLDVDVTHISGENNLCALGVVFRASDYRNLYGFRIGSSGTYSVWKEVDDAFVSIVGWTASDSVNVGEATNHLTVRVDGASLTFMINGDVVKQLTDATFASGYVGVYARIYDGATSAHEAFDNLVVTELE